MKLQRPTFTECIQWTDQFVDYCSHVGLLYKYAGLFTWCPAERLISARPNIINILLTLTWTETEPTVL